MDRGSPFLSYVYFFCLGKKKLSTRYLLFT